VKFFITLICLCFTAFAHNLEHSTTHQESIVVSYNFLGGGEFSYQDYEIYPPNKDIPYQVGRTNAESKIVFIPNQKGVWKIKAFSQDGHGKIITINVDKILQQKNVQASTIAQFIKPLVGLVVIFAIFGFIYLFKRRKIEKN